MPIERGRRTLERLVWQRAVNRCEYCQVEQAYDRLPFEIDHIIARKHRGRREISNLCLACFACNNHKSSNISGLNHVTRKIVPLFNPRRHKWARHFRWDGPVLVGLTPIGRATVIVLEMNLEYRVGYPQRLIEEGVFPPAAS
jgi:hypothetical protein